MMTVVSPKVFGTKKVQGASIEHIPSQKQSTRIALYKRLLVAKSYIEENYAAPFKLDELARAALVSKYHLLRSYKLVFGITPYQQVLQLRLQEASKLLLQDLSLEDIATMVGFSDRRSFTKAFRKVFGCSPSEFKRRNQK